MHTSVARVISTAGIFPHHRSPPKQHAINLLALHAEYIEGTEGRMLYSQGQPLEAVYCLLSGDVTVMRRRGPGENQAGGTDLQAGGSMELAAHVRTEGVLLGKMVEAYTGEHETREAKIALAREAAHETAEVCLNQNMCMHRRSILSTARHDKRPAHQYSLRKLKQVAGERVALAGLKEQVEHIQDAIAAQNLNLSDGIARLSSLDSHIQQGRSIGGNTESDEVDALEKQRKGVENKVQVSRTLKADLQKQLLELRKQIQRHESDFKIHEEHLHEVEDAAGKEVNGMPDGFSDEPQRTKMLGVLDDAWEFTHRR